MVMISEVRKVWDLSMRPSGKMYRPILECAQAYCTMAGVILEDRHRFDATCTDWLASVSEHMIREERVQAWPGTVMTMPDRWAKRVLLRYNESVREAFLQGAGSLFDWMNPVLPEDPHLLRQDGSTWLGTIAHENIAWFELAEHEYQAMRQECPLIASALVLGPRPITD